eukprot:TRINITY_DN33198_c0_g1_i1.p1 TRINITY_DN33198_c0_g1~~TRINITY_DN33198_c0_g1_i1.p1  ORF type:complete len:1197 (+),score=328.43 TRINITY_DN33198_c0_g1_i1:102-3692(+)
MDNHEPMQLDVLYWISRRSPGSSVLPESAAKNNPAGASSHKRISAEQVVQEHGVPRMEVQRYIDDKIRKAEAFSSLPFTLLFCMSYALVVLIHDDAVAIRSVENSVKSSILQSAKFAYDGPYTAHKDINDIENFADFWSWTAKGFLPLMFQIEKTFAEGRTAEDIQGATQVFSPKERGVFLNYNKIIGGEFGLHTLMTVNFYFSRGGHVWKQIVPFSAFASWWSYTHYAVFDMLFTLCLLRVLVLFVQDFKKGEGLTVWNWLDVIALVGGMVIILLCVLSVDGTSRLNRRTGRVGLWTVPVGEDSFDSYMSTVNLYIGELEATVHYIEILKLVLSSYPLVIVCRLFKGFAAQPRLALITNTLVTTGVDLLHFLLVFGSMFVTLAISGLVLFGRRLEDFVTFPRAVNAVFRITLGDFDWEAIRSVGQAEGGIWLFIALSVTNLLLLNMVLAIVLDGYSDVKRKAGHPDPIWTEVNQLAKRWWNVQIGLEVDLKLVRDALIELDKDFHAKEKLKDIISQRDAAQVKGDASVDRAILLGRDTMAVPGMQVLPVDEDIANFVGPGKVVEVGHLVCRVLHEDGALQKYNIGYDLSFELKFMDGGKKPEELTEAEIKFQQLQVLSPQRFMQVVSNFTGMAIAEDWARSMLCEAVKAYYMEHREDVDTDQMRVELRKVLWRTKKVKEMLEAGGAGQSMSAKAVEEVQGLRKHLNEFYKAVDEDRQRIHQEIRYVEADCAELHRRLQRVDPEASLQLERELGARLQELFKPRTARGVVADTALESIQLAGMQLEEKRTRALLIGINYFNTDYEMRGCINDVKNVAHLLTETFGWDESAIRVLTDDNPAAPPTKANILSSLHWLAQDARAGDVLFFHFSGHGEQAIDPSGVEEDGMNETLCPVDFQHNGMLTDDVVGEIVVKHLPEGVRLTSVMDCCHSGTGLDLPFQFGDGGWIEDVNPYHSKADCMLFSACMDNQKSADCESAAGHTGGAMTTAFCSLLRSGQANVTYPEFMARLQRVMDAQGFTQRPVLTSSQQFRYDRKFALDDAVPNDNQKTGRTMAKKFPPKPRTGGVFAGQGMPEQPSKPLAIADQDVPPAPFTVSYDAHGNMDEEDAKDAQLLASVDALLNESATRRGVRSALDAKYARLGPAGLISSDHANGNGSANGGGHGVALMNSMNGMNGGTNGGMSGRNGGMSGRGSPQRY